MPTDDLALRVAYMMGDQEVISSRRRVKVILEVPPSLVGRLVERIRAVLPRHKQPPTRVPGQSAQRIANGRRNDPLF
jgi:hypothetical protein